MKVKTLYSSASTIDHIVEDLHNQLAGFDAKLILFFASSHYDVSISQKLTGAFKDTQVVGCTTSGEIVSGKMMDQSVVAMAFSDQLLDDFKVELLENIKEDQKVVDKAFNSFESHFDAPMDSLDPEKYIGLVLIDGLSGCEEKINERIGDLTNISFVGGSTGDDLKFNKTYVYINGRAYSNAALLILLKPKAGFEILKTQSFKITDKILTVTDTVEENREIKSFNNKPATTAYAEVLEITEGQLAESMFKNPLGLVLGENEPFVRSPQRIEGSKIFFYCNVKEGTDLQLLRSTDIVEDTRKALLEKENEMGGISAVINFNCILRTLDLKQQDRTQEYADLFVKYPTVGFSTYGESYIGHINQTATMVLFK